MKSMLEKNLHIPTTQSLTHELSPDGIPVELIIADVISSEENVFFSVNIRKKILSALAHKELYIITLTQHIDLYWIEKKIFALCRIPPWNRWTVKKEL